MSEDSQQIRHREIIPRGNDEEDADPDRKTLYDQIQEAKELKLLEIKQQLEENNASYKLDDKSREFYNQIENQERSELKARKAKEAAELNKFKIKKAVFQNSDHKVKKASSPAVQPKIVLKKKLESGAGPLNITVSKNAKNPPSDDPEKAAPTATVPKPLSSSRSSPVSSLLQGYSDDSDTDS